MLTTNVMLYLIMVCGTGHPYSVTHKNCRARVMNCLSKYPKQKTPPAQWIEEAVGHYGMRCAR